MQKESRYSTEKYYSL